MGLLNLLFGGGTSKEACEVKVKISKEEMESWSEQYYKGATSYRTYFTSVISSDMGKFTPITDAATKKAEQGCSIDSVFVNFYYSSSNYILIPYDDFSEKIDMTISRRNNKVWNRDNILRILNNYPDFRNFDENVEILKNMQDGVSLLPEPIPEPAPIPEPIIPPSPKPISPPEPKQQQSITLESNGKSRLIVQTQTITREIVKSSFGNHNEIYNKQFEILKDDGGDWFVKGYDVPSTSKDAKGNVYNFHKTFYNETDITNRFTKLENNGTIKVGKVQFMIRF
ncbi:MAG: hypothetical protein U9N59_12625 [Campylobacterota bacterium]|nr:hypothetical protein [Campylobacterota bacterium]